jgi:hypothetical protein
MSVHPTVRAILHVILDLPDADSKLSFKRGPVQHIWLLNLT